MAVTLEVIRTLTTRARTEGVDAARRELESFAKAQDGVSKSNDNAARSVLSAAKSFDALERSVDPVAKANARLSTEQAKVQRALNEGSVSAERAAKVLSLLGARHEAAIALTQRHAGATSDFTARLSEWNKQTNSVAARMSQSTQATNDNAKAVGLARHEWVNLGRQFQDVGTMAAMGAAPMQIVTSQAAQIYDVLASSRGGTNAALKELGTVALRLVLNPVTAIAAAAGTAALAMFRWKEQTDALTFSLNGLGRQSGMAVSQVNRIAEAGAAGAGISNASARGLAGQFLNAGVPGGSLQGAIGTARGLSRGLGVDLEDAGKELAAALAEPVKGADDLARKYGIVSFAEREHIKQLSAVGDRAGASAKLLAVLGDRISQMQDPTTAWGRLLDGIGKRMSDRLDKLGQEIEGPKTFKQIFDPLRQAAENEKRAQQDIAAARGQELGRLREDSAFAVREIQARTFAEREAVATERARTQVMRETHDAVKASIAAESERAKLIAQGNREAEVRLRSAQDEAAMMGKTPLEQARQRILNDVRDFRETNLPNAATPMALEFNTAGNAAKNLAAALNSAASLISHEGGRRIIGISRSGSADDPRGLSDFIRSEAARMGIDPNVALRVAGSEGLKNFTGDQGSSFGAFQLHRGGIAKGGNAVGGLGDDFFRQTGLDPSNPANERAGITYALEAAKRMGWTPFHGAARAGIGHFEGIGGINDNAASGSRVGALSAQEQSLRLSSAERQFRIEPQEDFAKQIKASEKALQARISTLGQDQRAIDESTKRQELMNDAVRQTGTILPDQQAWIDRNAKSWADYQAHVRDADDAQRRLIENLDLVRGSAREALSGIAGAMLHGASATDALNSALERIADRLVSLAADRAIEGIFGKTGSASGGILGGLGSLVGGLFGGGTGTVAPFADGGIVGAPGGKRVNVPMSAFIGAPHFASGGAVPVIAHAGEVILNAAQQRSVAAALTAARGSSNDNRGTGSMAAAPVTVNLIGAPQGTKVQETRDSSGGRRIDVVMDERIAAAMGSPQGVEAAGANFGMNRKLAKR